MATSLTGPLVFVTGCTCAGSGCGGHVELRDLKLDFGVMQHTYTPDCAGHHGPGPCPPSQQPARLEFGG